MAVCACRARAGERRAARPLSCARRRATVTIRLRLILTFSLLAYSTHAAPTSTGFDGMTTRVRPWPGGHRLLLEVLAVTSNSSESPEAFAAVLLRVLRSTEAAAERRVYAQSQLSPSRSLLPRLCRCQSGMCRLQWRPSLRPWRVHRRAARPQELPWSPPLPDRSTRRAVLVL